MNSAANKELQCEAGAQSLEGLDLFFCHQDTNPQHSETGIQQRRHMSDINILSLMSLISCKRSRCLIFVTLHL